MHLDWDKVQEDEADRIAFKACLDRNYDVREVPNLYAKLQTAASHDSRVTLGFMGNRRRVGERLENVKDLIGKAYKADIDLKESKGGLIGDSPDYRNLIAEVKRDNGIMAFYKDMFGVARMNLQDAVAIRSTDPAAHYYYGKVLKLVGRSSEERKAANQEFLLAIRYDTRDQNFGAHLHRALQMIQDKSGNDNKAIVNELESYVGSYITYSNFSYHGSNVLPPNLDTILDYLTAEGDTAWLPKLPADAPVASAASFEPLAPETKEPVAAPSTAPRNAVPRRVSGGSSKTGAGSKLIPNQ